MTARDAIHYLVVLSPAEKQVVFTSDAQAGAPGFRLTYDYKQADALGLAFDIAAPDAPGVWKTYISAKLRRVR